ncbi:MAG TPA: LysR family transcriptional regulator [Streptosporangiaceae bacterium]|nr:LysR family transcriptional regulator [Streptosporangiaceae bacterium]
MLDVRKMYLLRELARLGTIAAVARAQFCTPSAVSQQLSALEREAGVRLIRRSGRRVELTAAGTDLARRTEPVLELLEEAAAALAASRTDLAGELRIGAFQTAVRTLLPAALVALGTEHPRLELRVTELDPAQVPEALRAGVLDIALVHEYDYVPAAPDPALRTEPLLDERMFLASAAGATREPAAGATREPTAGGAGEPIVAKNGGAAAFVGSQALAAARGEPWIVASPGTLCHLMAVRLCEEAGFAPRIRHYADDFAAVLTLVAAGQGVALVPELALAERPDGVTLTPLPARRRTLIACRAAACDHPAVTAGTAAIQAAAARYRAGGLVQRRSTVRSAAVQTVVVSR